jgi:hypothetical protein
MITTMTPVREMPSSTRLTPPFTPQNTKSIAGKNTPALQQRQGFDGDTLTYFTQKVRKRMKAANNSSKASADMIKNRLYDIYIPILNYIVKCLNSDDWAGKSLGEKKAHYAQQLEQWSKADDPNPYFKGNNNPRTGIINALIRYDRQRKDVQALDKNQKPQLIDGFNTLMEQIERFWID